MNRPIREEYVRLKTILDEEYKISEYKEKLGLLASLCGIDEPPAQLELPASKPSLAKAVRDAVANMPNEFTLRQLYLAMKKNGVSLSRRAMGIQLWRMARKSDQITFKEKGSGKRESTYKKVALPR